MKTSFEMVLVVLVGLTIFVLTLLNPIDQPTGHAPSDFARFIWTFG